MAPGFDMHQQRAGDRRDRRHGSATAELALSWVPTW